MGRSAASLVLLSLIAAALVACGNEVDSGAEPSTTVTTVVPTATPVVETSPASTPPPTASPAPPTTGCSETLLHHRGVAAPGLAERCSIACDELNRSYLRYIPPGLDGSQPVPLVISLHPAMQDAQTQMAWFPFDEIADTEGFIVVAPEAVDGFWNLDVTDRQYCDLMQTSYECEMIDPFTDEPVTAPDPDCRLDEAEPIDASCHDDLAFLTEIVAEVDADYAVDMDRVYLAGASWGGWLASRAACALGDQLAAVATMTNTMWYVPGCESSAPMAMIGIGGSDDPYHPACMNEVYAGVWAEHNECDADPNVTTDGDVRRIEYASCRNGATVVVYDAPGMWLYPDMAVPEGFDPVRTMWEFFASHPSR